jgi:hypothetical protein
MRAGPADFALDPDLIRGMLRSRFGTEPVGDAGMVLKLPADGVRTRARGHPPECQSLLF